MKVSLSTSLHLDHGTISLDQRPGDQPPMQSFVPIGLLSLKAAVDQANVNALVRVIELNGLINNQTITNDDHFHEQIVDSILETNDDLVGLMTDADSLLHTILIAAEVKRRSGKTRICLGGPASSPISSLLLERFPFIDFVARGEAERTFVELLQQLDLQRKPTDVAGLTWRDGSQVVFNKERGVIEDVDDLPIPAFEAYDMSEGAPLYLDVGRGCPFKCRFCATAPFWERRYRMKSSDRIVQEMKLIRDTYNRTHLNFSHDIFTCDQKWTMAFCERLISDNLGMTWTCSTRTDIITPPLLQKMAQAGCVEIYYGIESGSAHTQTVIDKGLDLSWSREIVRSTTAAGIRPVTGFIVGHPTETLQTLRDTIETFFDFLKVGNFRAHLFTLCPFHEAPMFKQVEHTISRPAEYAEIALTEPVSEKFEKLKTSHRDVFASTYRFATPGVPEKLIDASEGLSCRLVVLKSIWPLLLPEYDSALDWYARWTDWIYQRNLRLRPRTPLAHQGNAYDLLDFIDEELSRLGLEDSDVADLARYERIKLDAQQLDPPALPFSSPFPLDQNVVLARRCEYLSSNFRHDLKTLLSGERANVLDEEWCVIFAKTSTSYVDTLMTKHTTAQLLELARRPRTISQLLASLNATTAAEDQRGVRLIQQLCERGLLCEVAS
jgi:radical SAM superfamily enzyme YgiQ (UPF0313 family)